MTVIKIADDVEISAPVPILEKRIAELEAQIAAMRDEINLHRNAATAAYRALMLIAKGNDKLSPEQVANMALGWERELNELLDGAK